MKPDCYFCHIKTVEKLFKKFEPEDVLAEDFISSMHKLIGDSADKSNPELAADLHRMASIKLKIKDLYDEEKRSVNGLLLQDYDYWRRVIDDSEDPVFTAAKLAVIGNIIDYGAHSLQDDVLRQINTLFSGELKVNMTAELKKEMSKARSILYLGDNAGEIVFDRLLIETIQHPDLTYAVRGLPVINDATMDDAGQVGLQEMCNVISNGHDAPSTLLEFCSDEFQLAYKNADLIISKGQGNFEGLMDSQHPNTFFLLIAKCQPMAELLGVEKNDMVITRLDHGVASRL